MSIDKTFLEPMRYNTINYNGSFLFFSIISYSMADEAEESGPGGCLRRVQTCSRLRRPEEAQERDAWRRLINSEENNDGRNPTVDAEHRNLQNWKAWWIVQKFFVE